LLTKESKSNIIGEHKLHSKDTGSPEVQVALITTRINYLTKHFESHKQDYHSKQGLMKLVGQRKRLLEYLKNQDQKRYEKLIKKLKLRK
jgi:small subunit ribosomal protein S15